MNQDLHRDPGLSSKELSDCLGNLLSLMALPSLCHGRGSQSIMEVSLQALHPLLNFEVGYIRLWGPDETDCVLQRGLGSEVPEEQLGLLKAALAERVALHGTEPNGAWDLPCGIGLMRPVVVPLGYFGDLGALVVLAKRTGFPNTSETIQVRAAASLVASIIETCRTRESLEKAHREVEAANRSKDEFLAMLGHELRNPLAPIVTALQLMKLKGGDSGKERTVIERQVEHLRQLVDDLLDISRITRGSIELRKKLVECSSIIGKALEVASPLLEQRRHRLSVACPSKGLLMDVDPVRCAQVICNLLTNAAKYTEPHGSIRVRASQEGEQVVIRVRDTGVGISAAMLPRVFDLFVQEQRALHRSEGGLGLGLPIVKNLVTLHGGTVEAKSAGLGRGSEFTVRLPLALSPMSDPPTAVGEAEPEPFSADHTHRILVVDDNQDAGDLLAEILRQVGYEVKIARDGAEAMTLAKAFVPDAVLLDIGLPVIDGYEVAQRMRNMPEIQGTRLVAVTGYGQPADRRRSRAAGFDMHLVKPVDVQRLREVLRSLLGREKP